MILGKDKATAADPHKTCIWSLSDNLELNAPVVNILINIQDPQNSIFLGSKCANKVSKSTLNSVKIYSIYL